MKILTYKRQEDGSTMVHANHCGLSGRGATKTKARKDLQGKLGEQGRRTDEALNQIEAHILKEEA